VFSGLTDGGGFLDGGAVYTVQGSGNEMWTTDVTSGAQQPVFTLRTGAVKFDALTFNPKRGFGRIGQTYWMVASQDQSGVEVAEYLVSVNGEGVAQASFPLSPFIGAGEELRRVTSDGTRVWMVTNKRLLALTVPQ
jgi:hypothetical protein